MNSELICSIADRAGVPIIELPTERIAQISTSPQAQLRTARYKKAVYLFDGLVFKGPYRSHEPGLIKNLRFNHALEILETALQLHERERAALPWTFLGRGGEDQYYLASPNVGKRKDVPIEVKSSKLERDVKVIKRKVAVKRVSDIEGTEQLSEDLITASLEHLYLRFLLDIGDSGTHNVLVRETRDGTGRLIAGIDLEETRAVKVRLGRRLEHLFKKGPSKNQIRLYNSGVGRIKSLSFNRLDQHASEGLRTVGVDMERLKGNMELWERLK